MVNDGDLDGDGVPDFADNLDLFAEDGVKLQSEDWPECPRFVPILLHLVNPGSYDSLKVRLSYPASDPASIQSTSDGKGGYIYTPAPGSLRLWTKNGTEKRKVASVADGGDYVPADVDLAPAGLGFNTQTQTVTLYLEAVNVSSALADLEIKVTSTLDSEPAYPMTDSVRVTALNLSLMNVDEGNNVTKAGFTETSQPTPVIAVSAISVTQAQPSADAQYVVGTLNLAGTITSAAADITPISAGQNITEALVYLNNSADPVGSIPVTFTKMEDETSFLHPFPYNGSFAGALTEVTMLEGVNTVRVVAKDPLDGMEGYAEFSFQLEGVSPSAQSAGIAASLDVQLTAPLTDTLIDTITVTLSVPGTGTIENQTLTETAADSRVFANSDGTFQVTIGTGGEALDPGRMDEIDATASESTLGINGLVFPFMQETGVATKSFHKDIYSSDEEADDYTDFLFAVSQVSLIGRSDGGLFKPYLLQVQGPDLFLQFLQEIELDDGPRRVEQSPIDGKYYVRMKNSPTAVVEFYMKRIKDGEPNHAAILGAMKDYGSYEYGFAQGLYASGKGMFEGIFTLGKFLACAAAKYDTPTFIWRMSTGDKFETERRYIRNTLATAKKLAEIYESIKQDDLTILTALYNGTDVDPNDLSPYNTAMQDAAELIAELSKDLIKNYENDPQKRGYYEGYATFEILSLILPEMKAGTLGKLGKAEFLTKLRARPFFSSGKGAAAMERLVGYLGELWTTKLCFLGGTKVHTDSGLRNIEDVVPGDRVLSRDEETGEQNWKVVLDTITTHPTKVYDIHYSRHDEGFLYSNAKASRETLTATGEHPIYVSNRPRPSFVPVRELNTGDEFLTFDGSSAVVTGITMRKATRGNAFSTYNLEVQDYHTYFVGEPGVWVHNLGKKPCEIVFSAFIRNARELGLTDDALKVERFNVLVQTKQVSKGIPDAVWGRSSADVMQKMLDDYAAGAFGSVDKLPNCNHWWNFFGRETQGGVDIHHSVEKYIQALLGMPEYVKDLCPGIPLPRNQSILDQLNAGFEEARKLKAIHKGMENGGISGILQSRIPKGTTMTKQQIVDELKAIYLSRPELNNFWPAARDWLIKMQKLGNLDSSLIIN
jgi:hypothetical protein